MTSTPDESVDVCRPCSVSKTYSRSKMKMTIDDKLLRKKKKEVESKEKNEEEGSKDMSEVESSKEDDEEKVYEKGCGEE